MHFDTKTRSFSRSKFISTWKNPQNLLLFEMKPGAVWNPNSSTDSHGSNYQKGFFLETVLIRFPMTWNTNFHNEFLLVNVKRWSEHNLILTSKQGHKENTRKLCSERLSGNGSDLLSNDSITTKICEFSNKMLQENVEIWPGHSFRSTKPRKNTRKMSSESFFSKQLWSKTVTRQSI